MNKHLVHEATGLVPVIGEALTDFRGDIAYYAGFELPRHAASTGRVNVRLTKGSGYTGTMAYYPSVFNLVWTQ